MLPPHLGSPVSLLPQRQDCRVISFLLSDMVCDPPRIFPRFLHSLLKSASGCIDIAPTGHTLSHTPHPLQKNMFIRSPFLLRPSLSRRRDTAASISGRICTCSGQGWGRMLRHRPVSTSLADAPHAIVPGGTSCQHLGLLMPVQPPRGRGGWPCGWLQARRREAASFFL